MKIYDRLKTFILGEQTNKSLISNALPEPTFEIHKDIRDLIWVADGIHKNYEPKQAKIHQIGGIIFTISSSFQEEPSLIYTKETITIPSDWRTIERPPYYPSYKNLTPEQKWIYIKLLGYPYNSEIDIGFVFILYYGLERHLLEGNFDSAFNAILKLRNIHTNRSFQWYSANALILSSLTKSRGDMVLKFLTSLNDNQKQALSSNLLLICYYSFDIPLTTKDIIRMAKTFEFNKLNYIKNQSTLFEEILLEKIVELCGSDGVNLKNYYTEIELKKSKNQDVQIFANTSIFGEKIKIPLVSDIPQFKEDMRQLLESTHEQVKTTLANFRKRKH